MTETISSALGVLLAIGGIGLLYLGWQKPKRSWPIVFGGWVLALFSIIAWAQTSGIDKGPAKGIVGFIILILAALAVLAYRSPVKIRRTVDREAVPASSKALAKAIWAMRVYNIIMLIILSGLAAMAISTLAFMVGKALNAEHTANLTVSMFLFPMLWAGFAVMTGYVRRVLFKSAALLGLIAIPTLLIPALQ